MGLDEELLLAAASGDAAKVRELLERGANPNARDYFIDRTPLHYAAMGGDLDVAKLLLEHGADPNAKDKIGLTPLHHAALSGRLNVARLLLEHGADVNARDNDGSTPLHDAASEGYLEVAKLLLEHGADVNARSYEKGWTPLHSATRNGHTDVAKLLLEHGADPNAKDKDGRTPADVAREEGYGELARLIERWRGSAEAASSSRAPAPALRAGAGSGGGAVSQGEEILRTTFTLDDGEEAEFSLGSLGAGDTLEVTVEADEYNEYTVLLSEEGEGKSLLRTKIRGGKSLRFKVPRALHNAQLTLHCDSAAESEGELTAVLQRRTYPACPNCGAPIEPGAKYCWRCGAKLG
jgi:ankyrin repeat protein